MIELTKVIAHYEDGLPIRVEATTEDVQRWLAERGMVAVTQKELSVATADVLLERSSIPPIAGQCRRGIGNTIFHRLKAAQEVNYNGE